MKQVFAIVCTFFFLQTSEAQISVRVKKTTSGNEVDVKTPGKAGSSKDNSSKQGSSETKSQPATKSDTTVAPPVKAPADESYNGPAKVQLKSFWRHLEALRTGTGTSGTLTNAERMLVQVKQNDPNYNISALEAEVAGYRNKSNADAQAKSDAAGKADTAKMYFKEVWAKMINVYSKGSQAAGGSGKAYYDNVQEVNITEYQQKKAAANGTEGTSYIGLIDEMLADYDNYLKRADILKWNVTEVMVKARNEPNPQTKMDMLKEARYQCEAVLILSANNAAFKQKLDEVNKLLGSADSEAAKYHTSDFHKQNVGKIIWSNKPLVIGKEKDMGAFIKNDFKTGEAIFGTMYLGNNLKQLLNGNERMRIVIKVDNGTAIWGGDLSYIIVPLAVQDKSYFQFALLPDEQWFKDNYAPYVAKENWTYSYFMDELANSGDISHNITCELEFPTNIQDDIKGAVALDLGAGSANIKALSAKLHDQLMASRTLPKAGMSNPALEQQMLTAANNLGWNDKFLKTIITSSTWVVVKNELTSAILYRYLGAVCTTKSNDGKCYYQEFSFKQDYTGGGNYSSTVKYNSYGGKREIGCDKLK